VSYEALAEAQKASPARGRQAYQKLGCDCCFKLTRPRGYALGSFSFLLIAKILCIVQSPTDLAGLASFNYSYIKTN